MIRLIYISYAVRDFEQDELLELLEQSRTNNQANDITGMLLYGGDNFFQVLEGEQDVVETLYEKIKKDPRHEDCFVYDKAIINERSFLNWSMAFRNLNIENLEKMDGYNEFLNKNVHPKEFAKYDKKTLNLLDKFKHNTNYETI